MSMSSTATRTSASSTPCGVSASNRSKSASMPPLIRDRVVVEDRWTLLREAKSLADVPSSGAVIVPLALWRTERDALLARGDVGVWLAPPDNTPPLPAQIAELPRVALEF